MKLKKGFAVLVAVGLLGGLLGPASAEQYSRSKEQKMLRELNSIRSQKKTMENRKKQTQSQASNLINAIDQVKTKIDVLDDKIDRNAVQLEQVQAEAAVAEENLTETNRQLDEQVKVFNSRVRDIYENGSVSYLEVILSSNSFSDFLDRFEYMRAIVEQDSQTVTRIEDIQAKLQKQKTLLENKRVRIAGLKASAEQAKEESEQQKEEHSRLLEEAQKNLKEYNEELDRLEAEESAKMAEIIRLRSLKDSQSKGSGVMRWPAPGHSRITSQYGWRIHPILGTRKFHTGIDISAPSGSKVIAAQTGQVIYSGWMNGYGNVIVIDHGAGKSTLYAHLSRRGVSVGQEVKKGEQIGAVGSTGRSTGPHLHFEVRSGGDPVNPMPYL